VKSLFVLWGPCRPQWQDMTGWLAERADLQRCVEWQFAEHEREAFASLVFDIYADHSRRTIARKANWLLEHDTNIRVCVIDCDKPKALKTELRRRMGDLVPVDKYITCHATDNERDADYLADVLLAPVNMDYVRKRTARLPEPGVLDRIDRAKTWLRTEGIDTRDAIAVGGSVLEAAGLRSADDLDITVTSEHRARLGIKCRNLIPGVDLVNEGYHRTNGDRLTDDELIASPHHSFNLLGLKYATLPIVLDRKRFSRRPKDLPDIDLIEKALEA
jgi:hypothetical protein